MNPSDADSLIWGANPEHSEYSGTRVEIPENELNPSLDESTRSTSFNQKDQYPDPLSRSQTFSSGSAKPKKVDEGRTMNPLAQAMTHTPAGRPSSQTVQPKKEQLKGIYGFFGTTELPPTPKSWSVSELPSGNEIDFIFKNRCYNVGVEIMSTYIRKTTSPEEKMFYRIIKIMCLMRTSSWEKAKLEFSDIGNIDKMLQDKNSEPFLPFNLRLLYALFPFVFHFNQKSGNKTPEDKSIERLFHLYDYTEKKIKNFEYKDTDLYETEALDIASLCDFSVSEKSKKIDIVLIKEWTARLFRVSVVIIEVLLSKGMLRASEDFVSKTAEKFPDNCLIYTYAGRINQSKGEYSTARTCFDKVITYLTKDTFFDFIIFNTFLQTANEMKYAEAKALLKEMGIKFPQYSPLAYNNLAFIHIAEGEIKEAIDVLEGIIRSEPWNINDPIVLNLLTLYDFYYIDNKDRKKTLNEIIDRYAIDCNKNLFASEVK